MDDLIEKNMGLVVSVVNSFRPQNQTEREDYIQAGRIGLWKALKKYDPTKGAVLSTYAWNPIRWEIIKEIKSAKKGRYAPLTRARCPLYRNKDELWEVLPSLLSEEEVNFLELRKMGYKLAEMADITGRTSSYVKRIFYKAVKKIREKNE
jgi:DNA-directed RNA polymerase specialized sigma subunit|tara:strand:+ start:5164 stop:5613 length:450 start_codon:yes stop_codon:yes gene_type:complete